jgi:hypothetical protein
MLTMATLISAIVLLLAEPVAQRVKEVMEKLLGL